ncbi:uncharacterized protein LOC114284914 isoform X2 [Camellia sinensis]|uniref:uncharacterized protein LOC114284914 isoform X2 n=1 Tax=Camellia sinensis TaxID=4442 RepID=UPI001036D77A|nr:uncharacterized protein LOC114284914 isoform X2 [Camellia sinensis]XP_028083672.1 uncharacterized protein LOC114284914 isoform X2 [Camellia sinensis]
MDEVRSLLSLRALILNDNGIVSICRLDQLKELNTLVLSRNPINKLGESLVKVKSITKLSLSDSQLEAIDSLKSCTELKELRLAHNDIKECQIMKLAWRLQMHQSHLRCMNQIHLAPKTLQVVKMKKAHPI